MSTIAITDDAIELDIINEILGSSNTALAHAMKTEIETSKLLYMTTQLIVDIDSTINRIIYAAR